VSAPVAARLAGIRLVASDVDGVMTDGVLWYGEAGETLKGFHVRDGLGLKMLVEAGVAVAVVSARASGALTARLGELGIDQSLALLGRGDKRAAILELCDRLAIAPEAALFVGDDVLDLPAMRAVGLGVAVADAHPLVRGEAAWVTTTRGGQGALREICDVILEARGGLGPAVEGYLERRARR
jgi:3-deoxy-D-manno-octulosonate 8-phosphate phosphatase (KDO 8-P phosphatase)